MTAQQSGKDKSFLPPKVLRSLLQQLQEFHRHYRFVPERSTETEYVFLRTGEWLA